MEKCFHILLLEANLEQREFLANALRKDYPTTVARSSEECLAALQEQIYDLLILDYDMFTQVSGLPYLQKLIETYPSLPVIVVTALGNEELAVKILKAGARDYLRKSGDENYPVKVKTAISEIVNEKTDDNQVSHFLLINTDSFLQIWKKRILVMGNQIGSREQQLLNKEELNFYYRAYLQDIKNENERASLALLKRMVWEKKSDDKYILKAELLNISFKEAMREFIMKYYPFLKDYKKELMKRVGVIVDENNLSLSKEYEKVLGQSLNRIRTDERLATKYILLRTLQHEIRQPLSYIQNSAEILLTGECEDMRDKFIKNILDQAQKIEKLLIKLEDDSQMLLTNYSDDLLMVDVSWEGE